MATVRNVQLDIQKGGEGARRRVTVSYEICFTSCEAEARATFTERVTLRGDDPIWDDHLTTLVTRCIHAQENCVTRRVTREVSRRTLDEDGDTVIFGIPVFADRDEIYAQVSVTPFVPSGSRGNSNIVSGQFGAAGND